MMLVDTGHFLGEIIGFFLYNYKDFPLFFYIFFGESYGFFEYFWEVCGLYEFLYYCLSYFWACEIFTHSTFALLV